MSDILDKIIEAKEKMGDNAIEKIVKHYNLENYNPERKSASCPFHTDKTPSLIWNDKDKAFKCFSCSRRISILDMYIDTEGSYSKAVKRLCNETGVNIDTKSIERNKDDYFANYKYPKPEQNKIRDIVDQYCAKRRISKETLNYMGVKQDLHGNVTFEFHDLDGELVCKKYRLSKTPKNGMPKMWWDKDSDKCPVLYNIDKVDITKPIVITEGMFDTLSVFESGYTNVVSIPGGAEDSNWIDFNYEFLENIENFILWFDNDKAGQDGLKKVVSRLGEYRCKIVKPSKEDEDAVEKYYKTFNESLSVRKTDANNILLALGKDRVLSLINSAEEIPVENVVDLMTAEEFDIEKIGYIPTGIAELDKQLYGFIDGSLNIWTAFSGVGKTTLISQCCVLEAIDKGENVFWFNAESTTAQMLNWILSQAAGRQHMVEYKRNDGFSYYKPTPQAIEEIKKYYMNKIFVYDNLLLSSAKDVLDKMKYMYKKKGTKVFVLDNWLCLNFRGVSDAEITGIQVDFMNELIHFAKKNGLEIHLVAHPRKPQANMPLTEYDILGSSNIVNMADRIYGLEKVWDDDLKNAGFDRQFTIFKDRILGVKGQRIGLKYDRVTRRLYSATDDKYKRYNWDNGSIEYKTDKFGKNGILVGNRKLEFEQNTEDSPF